MLRTTTHDLSDRLANKEKELLDSKHLLAAKIASERAFGSKLQAQEEVLAEAYEVLRGVRTTLHAKIEEAAGKDVQLEELTVVTTSLEREAGVTQV